MKIDLPKGVKNLVVIPGRVKLLPTIVTNYGPYSEIDFTIYDGRSEWQVMVRDKDIIDGRTKLNGELTIYGELMERQGGDDVYILAHGVEFD